MDSKELTLDPSIDPNLDFQFGQPVDIPIPMRTEPNEALKAKSSIASASSDDMSWPHDNCWRSSRPIEPTVLVIVSVLTPSFVTAPALPTTWPAEHAILVRLTVLEASVYLADTSPIQYIPDCAKRCPYCPWKTERKAKVGNPAPMMCRHVGQYHLESNNYPGIAIDPRRVSLKREYEGYELTQGGRPTLEKTPQQT
ncbi:unnamed protein product [Penicillium egyptiacum]|uniref:Uncharacterized protein n=1 Tax=Penicillium egyptiacum TaxID=1303716 RepID=A0A9W4P212_9EURO|nr:unnamed protein product [Penicillium egyptiacum]